MERIKVYSCGLLQQYEHSIYDHLICFKRKIWNQDKIDPAKITQFPDFDYAMFLKGLYPMTNSIYQVMTKTNIPIYMEINEGHLKNLYLDEAGVQNIDDLITEAGELLLSISDQEIRLMLRSLSAFELNMSFDEIENQLDRMYPCSSKDLSEQFGISMVDALLIIDESKSNQYVSENKRNQEMEWEV